MIVLKRYLRWSLLSALSGLLAGVAAAIFLILLEWATQTRDAHTVIIWFLPLAGFLMGWVYHRHGHGVDAGSNLILDEIHDPRKIIPFRMAPFVLVGTVLTHLFGGSAGREGTAVQMGASLSDQLTRILKIEPEERKILLVAGAGAGFGAAIGAPWAGAIFGMEVLAIGKLRLFAWFQCLVASFVGFHVAHLVGAHHTEYPAVIALSFDVKTVAVVAFSGILFGLCVIAFVRVTHFIEHLLKKYVSYAPLKPFVGGVLVVLFFRLLGTDRYAGLGIPVILEALRVPSDFASPALKAFATALTLGSGFKGGEFIPLVFIGATLGSALSVVFHVSCQLLASVGFAAIFAGAANTPLACSIMAVELFGFPIAPYAFVACFMSYYSSGHQGIYRAQRVDAHKHRHLRRVLGYFTVQ